MSSINVVKGDITKTEYECVVRPIQDSVLLNHTVSEELKRAAGEFRVRFACRKHKEHTPGDCWITPGYRLKSKYIIHVVEPEYKGGPFCEVELVKCYINILRMAREHGIKTIALPLLAHEPNDYHLKDAISIADKAIKMWSSANEDYDIIIEFYCNESNVYDSLSRYQYLKEFNLERYERGLYSLGTIELDQ